VRIAEFVRGFVFVDPLFGEFADGFPSGSSSSLRALSIDDAWAAV